MRNLFSHKITIGSFYAFLTLFLLIVLLQDDLSAQVIRKSQVGFKASDGLLVTADLYQSRKSNPFIILFHQEKSCRGEFDSIASRFIKMNYNCLAVDLRSGDDLGFVKNETAIRAREAGYPVSLADASKDIEAAINYLYQAYGKKVSIYGSASSATLALIVGRQNIHVSSVVAFSPGEYFAPGNELNNILPDYPKPVFIAATVDEYAYLSAIEGFTGPNKILFKPTAGDGIRGTNALLSQNPSRDEYWLSLLIFFKSLR